MIHATRRKGMVGMVGMDKTKPWMQHEPTILGFLVSVWWVSERPLEVKFCFQPSWKICLISWSFLCQLQANAEWICYQTGHTNQQPSQDHDDGASRGQAGVLNWLVHQLLFHPCHRDPWGHFIHCEPLLSKKPVWGCWRWLQNFSQWHCRPSKSSNKEWLSDVSVLISNCPWYEVSRSA